MTLHQIITAFKTAPEATQVVDVVSSRPKTLSGLEVTQESVDRSIKYLHEQGEDRLTAAV